MCDKYCRFRLLRQWYCLACHSLADVTTPAAVDLIGVLAYGELVAFERNGVDASMAPTLRDKVELGRLAAAEYRHFEVLCDYLASHGVDPIGAMQPFVGAFDDFHTNLAPRDWLEGLMKTYVGDGIAADFYREVAQLLEGEEASVVQSVLGDSQEPGYVVDRLREAIAADPTVAGRLALWGRRLMGEMISQGTVVASSREALRSAFIEHGAELDVAGMVNRLALAHGRRMDALGLAS